MLVEADRLQTARKNFEALGRCVTAMARRPERVRALGFDGPLLPVTHEAAAAGLDHRAGQHACLLVQASGLIIEVPMRMRERAPDPRITWIVDFMHRHMSEPLTVATLASRLNLSRSRFTTLFTAQTGLAPLRYLQRARLRRARLLVERTFLSVKEVMAVVGYNDPSHFARDFRREHGVPPTALRREELTTSLRASPSDDPPIKRRIGPPRARDPGYAYA